MELNIKIIEYVRNDFNIAERNQADSIMRSASTNALNNTPIIDIKPIKSPE